MSSEGQNWIARTVSQEEGQAMAEQQTGHAGEAGNAIVYAVVYVEVRPPSVAEATALLRRYREASRQDEGQGRLVVLQQRDRSDHFAMVQQWQDQRAFEAHAAAAHTGQLRAQLPPLCVSPYDERLHHGFVIASTPSARGEGGTYVLTHADAIPAGKDEAMLLLQQLAEASRADDGNVRFEVLQQHNRQNHFTLVEIWRDQQALEAHAMAEHTRHFRTKFQPWSGSLYDERLYQVLD
jgi:quinol monooxygenase YgiN